MSKIDKRKFFNSDLINKKENKEKTSTANNNLYREQLVFLLSCPVSNYTKRYLVYCQNYLDKNGYLTQNWINWLDKTMTKIVKHRTEWGLHICQN
jgi:hypothetical protein